MTPTSFDLSPSGRTWGKCTITQVNGQRGLGFYRIAFQLNIDVHPVSEGIQYKLTGFSGDMTVQNKLLGSFAVPLQMFPLVQEAGWVTSPYLTFHIDLDRARLEALEETRSGGDLQLTMQYYAPFVPEEGRPYLLSGQAGLTISQSDWLRTLGEIEYARTVLIEVPVADARSEPELAAAAGFLSRAQQAMMRGEYREAVGLCRDVMEEMEKALPGGVGEPEFKDLKAKNKSERLALMRRAMRVFTHPARHRDEVSARFEWSRHDAVFAITTVAALLKELGAPDAWPQASSAPVLSSSSEPMAGNDLGNSR